MPLINRFLDTTGKPPVVKIAIWGPPQSGKTNYLAMLLFSPKPEGWRLTAGTKTTEFLSGGMKRILEEKEFIDPTLADDGFFYPFDFKIPGIFRSKEYTVYLPEYPGEYYENPKSHTDFVGKIAECDGVIWLVDPIEIDNPTQGRKSYPRMILEWLGILQEYGKGHIKPNMAFCLSKMDDPKQKIGFEDPRGYCLEKLGKPVQIILENFCDPKKVGFFATSTAGFVPGPDKISNVDPNNRRKLLNVPTPIGLFDPFAWLFDVI